MMIMEGKSDTLLQAFLNSITWTTPYGVLKGRCGITPLFNQLVPDSHEGSGTFEYSTPEIAGGQSITMGWYKWEGSDGKGEVVFRITEITKPS